QIMQQADVSGLVQACRAEMCGITGLSDRRWAVRSSATNEDMAQASSAGLYRTTLGVSMEEIPRAIKDLWASIWDERVVEYVMTRGRAAEAPAMAVVIQQMVEAQI